MSFRKIGVLMGGISAERDVSLESGRAVAEGLRSAGYTVDEIDVGPDLAVELRRVQPDAVYIALHGRWGEDGTVQGMLELMKIPYTGSSLKSSAVTMDKILTRTLLAAHDLPIPGGFEVRPDSEMCLPDDWSPPVVVKPADEGSSMGISIVHSADLYGEAVRLARRYSGSVLVEQFVAGVELTVAVLHGRVLGALEVEPHNAFYDYSAKYDDGGSTHHVPPRLGASHLAEVEQLGERVYNLFGCSGAARVDFIVPQGGSAKILELNTIPGMTEKSLFPEIAAHAGMDFEALVSSIIEGARLHIGKQ